jgi:hypothetical protein
MKGLLLELEGWYRSYLFKYTYSVFRLFEHAYRESRLSEYLFNRSSLLDACDRGTKSPFVWRSVWFPEKLCYKLVVLTGELIFPLIGSYLGICHGLNFYAVGYTGFCTSDACDASDTFGPWVIDRMNFCSILNIREKKHAKCRRPEPSRIESDILPDVALNRLSGMPNNWIEIRGECTELSRSVQRN